MAEVREVHLPGVGVRHDFVTREGQRVAVLAHRTGRRELLLYDPDDPDTCRAVVRLDPDDTRTLAELLGASQVSQAVASIQQVAGLAIDWITVAASAPHAGASLQEAAFRTATGASIVAVIRGDETIPAPPPDFALLAGDVVVAVGRPEGLQELTRLLQPGA